MKMTYPITGCRCGAGFVMTGAQGLGTPLPGETALIIAGAPLGRG